MAVVVPLAFAAAGAWAGTAVGIGAAAGWAIGSAIGSVVEASFAPKTAPQNTLADLSVQTANWGAGLPRVFGAQRMAGNIIWSTDKRMMGGSQGKFGGKGGGGGKGGKKGGGQQAYYEVSLAIALAEGTVHGIKRIWAAGDLIFDDSAPTYVPNHGQTGGSYQQFGSTNYGDYSTGGSSLGNWTLYHGTSTQTPDATIVANGSNAGTNGVPYQQMTLQNGHEYTYGSPTFGKLGTACAYRGVAYIVFPNLYLGQGGTIPPLTFEVVEVGAMNPISVSTPATLVESVNVSPTQFDIDPDGTRIITIKTEYNGSTYQGVINYDIASGRSTQVNNIIYTPYNGGSVWTDVARFLGLDIFYISGGATLTKSHKNGGGMLNIGAWWTTGYAQATFILNNKVWSTDGNNYKIGSPEVLSGDTYYGVSTLKYFNILDMYASVSIFSERTLVVINDVMYYYGYSSNRLIKFDGASDCQYAFQDSGIVGAFAIIFFTDGTFFYTVIGSTVYKTDVTTGAYSLDRTLPTSTYHSFCFYNGYLFGSYSNSSGGYLAKFNSDGSIRSSVLVTDIGFLDYDIIPIPQGIAIFGPMAGNSNSFGYSIYNPGDNQIITAYPTLPEVVSGLCDRAQFTNYDVSQLNASIPISMTIPAGSPARDVLSYLSKIYQFDMVDSAGLLKFVPKGQSIAAVVSIDDCGFVKQSTGIPPAPYTLSRAQGSDLPRSVTLKYMSRLANYTQNIRQFQISNPSGKDVIASVPMTLDDTTAANAAMLLCISPHIEKTAYSWSMSFKYLWVEPGDVLQMPWGVTRITQVAIEDGQNAPFINFQGVIDATYVINNGYGMAQSVPVPELGVLPVQPVALGTGNGQLINAPTQGAPTGNNGTHNKPPLNPGTAYGSFLEVPPLNSKQTTPYYLCYCYSTGSIFMGAAVFESTDGGSTFNQIGQQAVGGNSGFILEAIPNTQPFTWDDSTVLSAYVYSSYMVMESATDIQVLNGANLMKVGDELIQFGNAVLMTDTSGTPYYQLSRLLRGRRGTEWAMASHIAGEQFTMIVDNEDVSVPYALTDLNASNQYKVASAIQDISQVVPQAFAPTGVWFKPWSVANPILTLDTSNNWNLIFTPRARLNGYLASGVVSSLDPDTQNFSIDIYNGTTLKRTVTGQLSSPSFQYTAAMQSADGFSAGAHGIKFNIYQVGAQIGRGYVNTVTS